MPENELFVIEKFEKELKTFPEDTSEITQHLIELGYLPVMLTNALTKQQKQNAWNQFEIDLYDSDLFTQQELNSIGALGKYHFIKHFLRNLTDIDEGVKFKNLPEMGETSLRTRIIHYRLELLGLFNHPVNRPFSHSAVLEIKWLAEIAKCKEDIDAVNFLSDIEDFSKHLLKVYNDEQFILTFRSPLVSKKIKDNLDRRRLFGNQIKKDFGEKSDFLKYLQKNVLKANEDKIDYSFLEKERLNKFKKLIIRIIQVHQWQDGFYDGLLDSDIGEISLDSILKSIEAYNEAEDKLIKPHRVLSYLGSGYFMFNALFFLQEYMIEDNPADENTLWSAMKDKITESDDSEQMQFQQSLEEIKKDVYSNEEPIEKKGLLIRIYYGFRKLIKKALRFIRKLYKWVITKAKKLWYFLKKLFYGFFEKLHQGLILFVNGLKFLLGRKIIFTGNRNNYILSKCSLDGDNSILAIRANSILIQEHYKESKYQWGTLGFALALIGSVAKIIIQSLSIISWPMLLFTIVNSFKLVKEEYQELEIN